MWQTGNFLVPAPAHAPVTDILFGHWYVLYCSLVIGTFSTTFSTAVWSLVRYLLQFGHRYVLYCSLVTGTFSTTVWSLLLPLLLFGHCYVLYCKTVNSLTSTRKAQSVGSVSYTHLTLPTMAVV